MKREKGICVVGCGGYSHVHAGALSAEPGVKLFFASRSAERARKFARSYGGRALKGFSAALAEPAVDAVVLCGPHDRHLPDSLAALEAGKAVLLEKPLARSVAEGRRMESFVRRRGGLLMLAENFAFHPHLRTLRRALKAGRIGRPRKVSAVYLRKLPVRGWRLSLERMGGGILVDLGVHYLRLLQMAFGPILRARAARFLRGVPRMEGESEILAELEFSRGVEGSFLASWNRDVADTVASVRVEGTRGSASFSLVQPAFHIRRGGSLTVLEDRFDDPRGETGLVRSFLRSLRSGRAPEVGVREGIEDLQAVEAAYRSASAGGCWRTVRR